MIIFFQEIMMLLFLWLLKLIDGIMEIFSAIAGVGMVSYQGNQVNILDLLIGDSTIGTVFWCIMILAVGLTCLFAVVGLVKNMIANNRQVSGIIGKFFLALLGTLAMLAVVILGVLISNAVLKLVDELFQLNGSAKLSTSLFNACVGNWKKGHSIAEFNTDVSVNKIFGSYSTTVGIWPKEWKGNGMIDPNSFMYLPAILAAIGLTIALIVACINLTKRIYEIVLLYLIMPISLSTLPLDDGARFKIWREQFISKIIIAYGTVFAVNLFILLLPIIMQIKIAGASSFANTLFFIVMLVGGAIVIPSAQQMFTRLFGSSEDSGHGGHFLRSAAIGGRMAAAATVRMAAKGIKGGIGIGKSIFCKRDSEKKETASEKFTEDSKGTSNDGENNGKTQTEVTTSESAGASIANDSNTNSLSSESLSFSSPNDKSKNSEESAKTEGITDKGKGVDANRELRCSDGNIKNTDGESTAVGLNAKASIESTGSTLANPITDSVGANERATGTKSNIGKDNMYYHGQEQLDNAHGSFFVGNSNIGGSANTSNIRLSIESESSNFANENEGKTNKVDTESKDGRQNVDSISTMDSHKRLSGDGSSFSCADTSSANGNSSAIIGNSSDKSYFHSQSLLDSAHGSFSTGNAGREPKAKPTDASPSLKTPVLSTPQNSEVTSKNPQPSASEKANLPLVNGDIGTNTSVNAENSKTSAARVEKDEFHSISNKDTGNTAIISNDSKPSSTANKDNGNAVVIGNDSEPSSTAIKDSGNAFHVSNDKNANSNSNTNSETHSTDSKDSIRNNTPQNFFQPFNENAHGKLSTINNGKKLKHDIVVDDRYSDSQEMARKDNNDGGGA